MSPPAELLSREFFRRRPTECAEALIGCRFEWEDCAGVIVETEAYETDGDPACHTHFRPSARQFVAAHDAGVAYVYLNYGVHWLFNILVKGTETSGFVLFRALEPAAGLDLMRTRRKREDLHDLCSGPGKLTQALGIDGQAHGRDLFRLPQCRIFHPERGYSARSCRRIGISKAQERLWRYLWRNSPSVSVPPREA